MKKLTIACLQIYQKSVDSFAVIIKMFIFVLDNTVSALVVRTSHLFKVEYAVRTTPGTVYERVILRSITASAPAQSDVCSDTSNLGIERDHVALQSGIGQVQYFKKNMQRNFKCYFLRNILYVNHIIY